MKTKKIEQNDELNEAIEIVLDAIAFPIYIGKVVIIPLLASIVTLIICSFLYVDGFTSNLLLFIVGFLLLLPIVILSTPLLLLNTVRKDINTIIQVCISTSKKIASKQKDPSLDNASKTKKSVTSVKSTMEFIVVPAVSAAVNERIPFVGFIIVILINKVANRLFKRKEVIEEIDQSIITPIDASDEVAKKPKYEKVINTIFNSLVITLSFVFAPVIILTGVLFTFLVWALA